MDSYLAILQKRQSETPTDLSVFKTHFTNVGVENMDGFKGDHDDVALKMFIDAVKVLNVSKVDTVIELEKITEAVKSVFLGAAKTLGEPSLEDLQTLGVEGVNEDNLASIQYQINNGSNTDKLFAVDILQARIGSMVENFDRSITLLKQVAGAEWDPGIIEEKVAAFVEIIKPNNIYVPSISNLNDVDFKVIIALLLTPNITPDDVGTAAKIQSIVDGYKAIMNAVNTVPLKEDYEVIGVKNVDTDAELALMGDVISKQLSETPELVGYYQAELQALANAVQHVMDAATVDATALTVDDLNLLGISNVVAANFDDLKQKIADTGDVNAVDSVTEIQLIVSGLGRSLIRVADTEMGSAISLGSNSEEDALISNFEISDLAVTENATLELNITDLVTLSGDSFDFSYVAKTTGEVYTPEAAYTVSDQTMTSESYDVYLADNKAAELWHNPEIAVVI